MPRFALPTLALAIREEFDAGVTGILTPDQAKQWGPFKVELEKELAEAGARKQLAAYKAAMEKQRADCEGKKQGVFRRGARRRGAFASPPVNPGGA